MYAQELTLRRLETPADYARMAEIYNTAFWAPTTAAALEAEDRARSAASEQHRLVAVDPTGQVVAYGALSRDGHEEPGNYEIRVAVDEKLRRRGIGTRLLTELEHLAGRLGATRLDSKLRDDAGFFAFAEQHGYTVHERQLGWSLDLAGFDERPFVDVLTRLTGEGLRFVSLADNEPQLTPEALYKFERDANHDEPGFENEPFILFDQWYAETYRNETRPLDCTVVAMDGAAPVAMSAIVLLPNGNMRVTFTGVHRDYRGRGLAQATKLLTIRAAKRYGAARLMTGNSERNHALLHVNAKFGFERRPGMYWCVKHLAARA